MTGSVRVVDYDPAWPGTFQELRARIWPAVAGVAVTIEHVGSTAVPGLAAKPVIDVDVVVPRGRVGEGIACLEALGYQHRGDLGIPEREAFRAPDGWARHHLYLCPQGSVALANHLAVRDHLRAHAADARAYATVKRRLAGRFPDDMDRYVEGKTAFLLGLLERAGFPQGDLRTIEDVNRHHGGLPDGRVRGPAPADAGTRSLICAAVLFDMDGVLVDSRAVVRRVWRRWSEGKGLDPDAVLRVAQGRRTVDTLRSIAQGSDVEAELRSLEQAELEDREGLRSVPGALELVTAIPDERWAVVTSAGRELAERRLQWTGLPMPRRLVTAEDVVEGKPSPEGYLKAAVDLDVLPADCIVIEDAPAGVRAALAAGMRVIGVTTTHDGPLLTGADMVLSDLRGVRAESREGVVMLTRL